jgi:ketosteroid isomerase-like protein
LLLLAASLSACAASNAPEPAGEAGRSAAAVPTLAQARAGIEEGYRRNTAALLAKDIKAVMALRTEDFHSIAPDGKRLDRAAMEAYTGGFLNGVDRWIELSFEIESLTLDGREADAITRQHAVRMQLRNDNKIHHVETWVTQRERWRLTSEGWKLAKVDDIRDQKRLVDGQPG